MSEAGTEQTAVQAAPAPSLAESGSEGTAAPGSAPRRRRRRRGGRGRGRGGAERPAAASTDSSGDASAPPESHSQASAEQPKAADNGGTAKSEGQSRTRASSSGSTGTRKRIRPVQEKTAAEAEAASAGEAAEPGPEGEAGTAPKRRRRRRGGRGRGRSAAAARAGATEEAGEARESSAEPAKTAESGEAGTIQKDGASKPGRRRRRATAKPAGEETSTTKTEPAPKPAATRKKKEAAEPEAAPRRRRKKSEGGAESQRGAGEAAASATRTAEPTRTRRRRLPGRRRREPVVVVRRAADKVMLITELDDRDQIAVLQGPTLIEHYITRSGARSMVGNIYLGKVQNVLPGMEAAFIDVGRGRNAVLYAGEVSYDEEIDGQAPRIEHVLKTGKNVIVQVTKDPIGGKGARLTQEISLPGRYVVFVPNSETFGISRRLPDAERQRLKEILKAVRPKGHGLIVRTAADGATEEDLRTDLEQLVAEWEAIEKSAKRGRAPRVLYEEPELTIRVVRDVFTESEFTEIVTDSRRIFDLITDYLGRVSPDLASRIHMQEGPLGVMEAHHVTEQVHKALDRKVWLPSGGYIVIDRTEAMTVIDVNTGRHVSGANLEETVTKTNVEAAEEIARQLRLRDIGGMIIVDFIDMLLERNKEKVIQTLSRAMAEDKTRSQVFEHVSPLGLVEVTRKRVSAGLLESFSHTCPECEGRGVILDFKV